MDVHILCTSITLYVHNTILSSAKLLELLHFVKYLTYTGFISHITHNLALKPLFSLNASSVIRENYYAQQRNST